MAVVISVAVYGRLVVPRGEGIGCPLESAQVKVRAAAACGDRGILVFGKLRVVAVVLLLRDRRVGVNETAMGARHDVINLRKRRSLRKAESLRMQNLDSPR
jgi:hypothetical protein